MTDDKAPHRLRLTGGARLVGDRVAVSAMVFRGPVHLSTEEVFLSVDDASVLQAQLTRALDERSFPGLEQRDRDKARMRHGF
ncbi:hypothetical protein ACWIG3_34905 [Streptomyces celluloflavus]|uniref:Uncharacterized protein n=2 Tax=Streptomyces TaxID=1883 RepID=A0A4Q9HUJ6_STRKA|nr:MULTISPECIES: hypothetical protein [Streptomyces]MYU52594.1 hypothetical protein [Streptomyces sp. SID7805]TBO57880.1 hypothetical protein EYS09_20375 [Streptomyces kasugaensis]WSK12636.1 hypothetical protein OG717_13095 [Streptomyces celluloflavus]